MIKKECKDGQCKVNIPDFSVKNEIEKKVETFYKYNLDFDSDWEDNTTDLLRRKWIVNNYFGISPNYTHRLDKLRIDIGGEFRIYEGDHFGEVSNFSNNSLTLTLV